MKHHRTAKELLVHFLKAKADKVAEYSDTVYLDKYDYNEILGWSEEQCTFTLSRVVATTRQWDISDPTVCPWCVQGELPDQSCANCGYAQRHVRCVDENSHYQKILNTLHIRGICCITYIPRMQRLCERYVDLFKCFLKKIPEKQLLFLQL